MPSPRMRLALDATVLSSGLGAIRAELGLPGQYDGAAVAEARAVTNQPPGAQRPGAQRPGAQPPGLGEERADETGLALVTIDPPGSRDLDQAVHIARRGGGYRVHYAIADPSAFVASGGPLDAESRRRGATLYAPDSRIPLYPDQLGEGVASLLPDADRPAVLWRVDLDSDGEPAGVDVCRATVRSRAMLSYAAVQASLDVGTAEEPLQLLREVGRLREAREAERGAVSLRLPTQEVLRVGATYRLAFTAPLPVEGWNAQISLLTGICAARIMLDGRLGLLRTLPPPDPAAIAALRRTAAVLGVEWDAGAPGAAADYPELIRRLDPRVPAHAALLTLSATLLRGAGYTAFDGETPEHPVHSAVAAPYAHVTAPLRRLADRFTTEVVLGLVAGRDVPAWARETLPALPGLMTAAARRQRDLEHAVVDYVEAVVLSNRVGETFDAVVVESHGDAAAVVLAEPAVRARVDGGGWPLGEQVRVRLVEADPATRRLRFVRS